MIAKQDVIAFAPELATVNDTSWGVLMPFANELMAEGIGGGESGPLIRLCRILLAAHYATVSARGSSGATGPVTSEAAGAIRRSYGLVALSSSDSSLGSTGYGQQFLGIIALSQANGPRLL